MHPRIEELATVLAAATAAQASGADIQSRLPAALTAEGNIKAEDPNVSVNHGLLTNATYGLNALLTAIGLIPERTWEDPNASGGSSFSTLLLTTTVAVAGGTGTFTLTAGKASAGAYVYNTITVTDAHAPSTPESRVILRWTAGRVVTVDRAFTFTPAAGDVVKISEQSNLGW